MQDSESNADGSHKVVSPFSDTTASYGRKSKGISPAWILLAVLIVVVGGLGGFFLVQQLNDPLRTLEPFPVSKYLASFKSLAGSKFQANLRVENDLGWKEGVGRLMVFTVREDPNPIVVMIPADLSSVYFVKGQHYRAEIEVKEGGLIYANSIQKN